MRIIHFSYAYVKDYSDPESWLTYLTFYTGILESMARTEEVINFSHIRYRGQLRRNGVEYRFTNYSKSQLLFPLKFNREVKRLNPDVVIVHGLTSPWQVLMLRWAMGGKVKIIAQHHAGPPLKDIRQFFQKWADRYIKAYFFCSKDLGALWTAAGQIHSPEKIYEVMEASSTFHPIEKELARSVSGMTGKTIFLWVGRLDTNKDPLTVVRSFIQYRKINHEARLYMVYRTSELLDQVTREVANANAHDYVHLAGKVANDQLLYWYNSADFIISSSHNEGSGVAVCEALACGCIPVLSNIPSFRMMTNEGHVGVLYDAGDETALVKSFVKTENIDRVTERNEVLKWFREKLSFDGIAKDILDVVHSL